jgi:hypothetical protein
VRGDIHYRASALNQTAGYRATVEFGENGVGEAILDGRQPHLTAEKLLEHSRLPGLAQSADPARLCLSLIRIQTSTGIAKPGETEARLGPMFAILLEYDSTEILPPVGPLFTSPASLWRP